MSQAEKAFYTAQELAQLLNVNDKTIHRLVSKGELTCYYVGSAKRFSVADVAEYLQKHSSKADAQKEGEPR